jgi:hypothetical protein
VVAALADATAPKTIAAPESADKNESFFIVSPLKLNFRCELHIVRNSTVPVFILAMTKPRTHAIQKEIF